MNEGQRRFRYHINANPKLRFWIFGAEWTESHSGSISDEENLHSQTGLVTYSSGEALCQYGAIRQVPDGVHFMTGPVYFDDMPGFSQELVRNGEDGLQIVHGPSRSQAGSSACYYSTKVVNQTKHRVRVTKFAPFDRGLLGINKEPNEGCYSPTQFREWYRVSDAQGWTESGFSVCDPDNYGMGSGVWAYFMEAENGARFIATAPLENQLKSRRRRGRR